MSENQNQNQNLNLNLNQENNDFHIVRGKHTNNNNNNNFRPNQKPRMNRRDVLEKVSSGEMTAEEANKLLGVRRPPRFVVTNDGTIALYNLQRYPIVLYADQWERIEYLMKRDIFANFVDRNSERIHRRFPKREYSSTPQQPEEQIEQLEEQTPE